jgi:delta 1-pyrroline-5-carboxylate dehydrogenase
LVFALSVDADLERLRTRMRETTLRDEAVVMRETGGLNAMVVDATALPEQVVEMSSALPSRAPGSAARRFGSCISRRTSPIASSKC